MAVAQASDDFRDGVEALATTWRSLTPERVYRTDAASLASIGLGWVKDVSGGGLLGPSRSNHLLDTAPLRALLQERLVPARMRGRVAVTATNYQTGSAITFYQGAPSVDPWTRSNRLARPAQLSVEHVMASAAIPIFFPPVAIDDVYFGDGCIRMTAPLSPAIHLGAERLVAIGIRYIRSPSEVAAINVAARPDPPTLSDVAGVLLNAVFLDSLDADLERMQRINATLSVLGEEQRRGLSLRQIPVLPLRPSRDLGHLAAEQYDRFPRTLRYLLRGIGATGDRGWDLLSYLAFEPIYIETLMALGYEDTLQRRAEVEAFWA